MKYKTVLQYTSYTNTQTLKRIYKPGIIIIIVIIINTKWS